LIRKAFDVSVEAHKEQRRKSGRPIFSIPLLWQNSRFRNRVCDSIAALLHDVVEDTPTTVKDIERIFNPKVAQLVEGLTISLVQKDMNVSKPKTFVKCY
jgi:GTP pyrophosphokinase